MPVARVSGLAPVATSGSFSDLINKPTIPAGQVNSDWNAASGLSQILNKPTFAAVAISGSYNDLSGKPAIPAAQVQSDWSASSGMGQILNKPTLASVALSGSYPDLSGKPTLGTAAATAVTDYATAAQGAKADSALQPNGNATLSTATVTGNATVTGAITVNGLSTIKVAPQGLSMGSFNNP